MLNRLRQGWHGNHLRDVQKAVNAIVKKCAEEASLANAGVAGRDLHGNQCYREDSRTKSRYSWTVEQLCAPKESRSEELKIGHNNFRAQ